MQERKKQTTRRLLLLAILAIAVVALFLFYKVTVGSWEYNLPRRAAKIAAIAMTGIGIGLSSLVFQTITNNRVLTPSVMGLDSLYILIQTAMVFFMGYENIGRMNEYGNFFVSCGFMILFSAMLYVLVFKREGSNVFVLILVGMIFGSLFDSLAKFMQVLIDPNEFEGLMGKMFASFNNVNTKLLGISAIIIGVCFIYIFMRSELLDVLALGREHAISLGVNYQLHTIIFLIIVAVLVSVSTALVGPVTFLGVLVVNLAREILQTHKHRALGIATGLISVIALVGGQFLVERVFHFQTPISVVINFVGGIYFIFLLVRERSIV